jgi:single-strand DNA-binding protein
MASMNRVYLLGNLTRDPEVRYLSSGKAVADLRLAVNRKYRTASGEEKDETCYVSVAVWGRQAETCGQYLSKGSPALVEGRLQYEEWEKDGQKNNRLRVVAERVQFVGAPRRAESGEAPSAAAPRGPADARPAAPTEDVELPPEGGDADNLPF